MYPMKMVSVKSTVSSMQLREVPRFPMLELAPIPKQSLARLGHALAKATVKRLLATPTLPLIRPLPHAQLARNRPHSAL